MHITKTCLCLRNPRLQEFVHGVGRPGRASKGSRPFVENDYDGAVCV